VEEWLTARLDLLKAEKELTRRSDELSRQRQELPWVPIDKEYRFETEDGSASLADLFRGRSQLLIYHFMFRARLYGRLCNLLEHRGRVRRIRRAPGESRRHTFGGVAGAIRETAGIQAADGLEFPLGVLVRRRLQLRLQRLVYQGATARGGHRI